MNPGESRARLLLFLLVIIAPLLFPALGNWAWIFLLAGVSGSLLSEFSGGAPGRWPLPGLLLLVGLLFLAVLQLLPWSAPLQKALFAPPRAISAANLGATLQTGLELICYAAAFVLAWRFTARGGFACNLCSATAFAGSVTAGLTLAALALNLMGVYLRPPPPGGGVSPGLFADQMSLAAMMAMAIPMAMGLRIARWMGVRMGGERDAANRFIDFLFNTGIIFMAAVLVFTGHWQAVLLGALAVTAQGIMALGMIYGWAGARLLWLVAALALAAGVIAWLGGGAGLVGFSWLGAGVGGLTAPASSLSRIWIESGLAGTLCLAVFFLWVLWRGFVNLGRVLDRGLGEDPVERMYALLNSGGLVGVMVMLVYSLMIAPRLPAGNLYWLTLLAAVAAYPPPTGDELAAESAESSNSAVGISQATS